MGKGLRTFIGAILLVSCATFTPAIAQSPDASRASEAVKTAEQTLGAEFTALARLAEPGRLGVTVVDLGDDRTWGVNEDDPFPMMSVFKAPLAATVLSKVDDGSLDPDRKVILTRKDLRKGASRIATDFRGERMSFTVGQLLELAVSHSDNTAADALVRLVGGPQVVTGFLHAHGIEGMRVDLDEGGIEHVFSGLGSNAVPPSGETEKESEARRWRGYQDFLDDPRNRSTPTAAALFLRKLWQGELLAKDSTSLLLKLIYGQTVPRRLSAGLPDDVRLAHKSGTSISMRGVTAAFNDIGILIWPDGHAVIVAAFLTASHASREDRNALFADLARAVVREVDR